MIRLYALIGFCVLWSILRCGRFFSGLCWQEDIPFCSDIECDIVFYPLAWLYVIVTKSILPLCVCCLFYCLLF